MSEQLTRELIDRLAEVLGTTAPYIWGVYLRQQMIQPVADLGMTMIGVVLSLVQVQRWYRWSRSEPGVDHEISAVFGGMATIAATWLIAYVVYSAALHLLNPEYYALDALLRAARGGK